MKRDYYESPEPGKLMKLFWKAAGGDEYLLKKATYSDQIKYFCLGGIILATGLMAGLAGGYAFYTIFSPKTATPTLEMPTDVPTVLMASVFGIIWGLIIFNIDRFIVTSTGTGDGTEAITWAEFKGAIPRIVMGAIIAVTISKPVEIRMFQSEIAKEVEHMQNKQAEDLLHEAEITFGNQIKVYKEALTETKAKIDACDIRIKFLDSMISYETFNGGCQGKCEENKRERLRKEAERKEILSSEDYVSNDTMIKFYTIAFNKKKNNLEQQKKSLDGLLLRIQALHKIAPNISLFIMLLFLAIELTPIFFKLMLIKTPYDFMKDNVSDLIKAESGIEIKYDYYEDKKGQDRHLVINHNAENMIYEKSKMAQAQKELIDLAIEEYKLREEKKIKDNLEDYIKGLDKDNSTTIS